ncbi:oligopeptide transporter 4-like protein [Tanacetum coccineum]
MIIITNMSLRSCYYNRGFLLVDSCLSTLAFLRLFLVCFLPYKTLKTLLLAMLPYCLLVQDLLQPSCLLTCCCFLAFDHQFLAMFLAIFLAILLHSFTLLFANFLLSNKPCCCDLVAFFSSSAVIKKLAACFRLSLITLDVIVPFLLSTHQVLGTIIAGTVNLGVAWYLLSNIDVICHPDPKSNSPWTCSNDTVFFDASVIWGLVGPKRIFGPLGNYGALNWFFLGGIMGPIAWKRYNYILSAALDAGVAFMAVLLYFTTGLEDRSVHWWGTDNPQHCDLATCPTAKGKGIPVDCKKVDARLEFIKGVINNCYKYIVDGSRKELADIREVGVVWSAGGIS